MKLIHPVLATPVYQWRTAWEFDVAYGETRLTMRIELWQASEDRSRFRARGWEIELLRLTPTFPRDEAQQPCELSDDGVLVERLFPGRTFDQEGFTASDVETATGMVLEDIKAFLEQITGIT